MAYINNGVLTPGKRHFFSWTIHRWSFLAQHPTRVTYRELVSLVYFIYCVYEVVLTLTSLRYLLLDVPVEYICDELDSGMSCLVAYAWLAAGEVLILAGKGAKWLVVLVVAIFFGEEFIFRLKGKP